MKIRTILILCAISICYVVSWGQTWKLTKTMTATLDKNVLTIRTTLDAEDMRDYDWAEEIWHERNAEIHSIVIEDNITGIYDWAFAHTPNVTSVKIANSVTYIGDYAFYNCGSLESVKLSEKLDKLGHAAFKLCKSLKSLDFPASVTVIGGETGAGCTKLEAINVHPDNARFSSDNGVLFSKDKTTLLLYPEGKKSNTFAIPGTVKIIAVGAFYHASFETVTIPNSVEEIRADAFSTCTNLKSITIPNSVKTINEGVFAYCEKLTSIQVNAGNATFTSEDGILYSKDKSLLHTYAPGKTGDFQVPSFVKFINFSAFAGCFGLTSITIHNKVTELRGNAFADCRNLTSITIPYSVTVLGGYVLSGCIGLKEVKVEWKKPLSIDSETFKHLDIAGITLYVPTGTIKTYQDEDIWKDFGKFVEYEFTGNEKVVIQSLNAYSSNGILYITGLQPGKPFQIYNLAGQYLFKGIAKSEEEQIVPVTGGIYIVVSEKQSVKVIMY